MKTTRDSALAFALFAAALALGALFAAALLIPEAAGGQVAVHPDHPTLLQGGSGAERHGPILWLGWGVGTLEILLFVAFLALGARRGASLRGLGKPLLWGTAAYLAVWTWLILAYRGYASRAGDADPSLFLALPAPTAIMLYVLWPVPVIFVVFFVAGFRRWVLTEEDQAAFERLVARRRAREASAQEGGGP